MLPLNLTSDAPLFPHVCKRCGATPQSPGRNYMLDLGIFIEYEGVIYICNICVDEFVKFCPDVYVAQDIVNLNDDIAQLQIDKLELENKLSWYDKRLAELGISIHEPIETSPPVGKDTTSGLSDTVNFTTKYDETLIHRNDDGLSRESNSILIDANRSSDDSDRADDGDDRPIENNPFLAFSDIGLTRPSD